MDNRTLGTEVTAESIPGQVREEDTETVSKDYVMEVEYPSQIEPVEQEHHSESTGQTGLDDDTQVDRAYVSSTQADLTATDPRLAQVLPESAAVVGVTPTYYEAYPAPLSTVPPQTSSPSAPPLAYLAQQQVHIRTHSLIKGGCGLLINHTHHHMHYIV